MTVLRQLFLTNLERIIPLCLMEAKELGIKETEINFKKLRQSIEFCAEHGAVFVTMEESGYYSGCMVLSPQESFWSDKPTLCNIIYYVDPKYRGRAGKILLKAAINHAKLSKIDLNVYVDSPVDLDKKDRFFQRHSMRKRGSSYTLEVQNA